MAVILVMEGVVGIITVPDRRVTHTLVVEAPLIGAGTGAQDGPRGDGHGDGPGRPVVS